MAKNTALPLARFHVLDLTRARAGPTCVRQLVDWGAQAVTRQTPGEAPQARRVDLPPIGSSRGRILRLEPAGG